MRKDVPVVSDVTRSLDSDTDGLEVVDDVVGQMNVLRFLNVNSPAMTVVDSRVGDAAVASNCSCESDSSLLGVNLRAVLDLDVIHDGVSVSE